MSVLRFHYIAYILLSYNVPSYSMQKSISLHDLARQNNSAELQKALDRGLFIDQTNPKGQTALHIAAKVGHLNMVLFLLSKGADIGKKSEWGDYAVTLARENGHDDIVQVLEAWERKKETSLSKMPTKAPAAPSEINKLNEEGKSLLHKATEQGDLAEALRLIELGADVHVVNKKGGTVLHTAAYCGQLKLCQLFVKQGCRVNATNAFGNTPLHVAAIQGHSDIVSFLMISGANVTEKNNNDHTALEAAKFSHKDAVVAILSEKSPTKTQKVGKNKDGKTNTASQNPLVQKQERISQASTQLQEKTHTISASTVIGKKRTYLEEGNTELHDAAHEGNLALVNKLLKGGVSANILNARRMSPIFFAAAGQHLSVLVTLLEKGASYDLRDEFSLSPSHYATLRVPDAEGQVISFLTQKGYLKGKPYETNEQLYNRLRGEIPFEKMFPEGKWERKESSQSAKEEALQKRLKIIMEKVNALKSISGSTVMHIAAFYGDLEIMELYYNQGHSVSCVDSFNHTPVHEAALSGQLAAVKFLVDHGASVIVTTDTGYNPLHEVIIGMGMRGEKNGGNELITLLLDRGCNPNSSNGYSTPFFEAVEAGLKDVCEAFIASKKANVNCANKDGVAPLHVAYKNMSIVKMLLENGANINAQDKDGRRPIHYAAFNNALEVVEFFLSRKAYVDSTAILDLNGGYNKVAHPYIAALLIKYGANCNELHDNRTILHVLVRENLGSNDELLDLLELVLMCTTDKNIKSFHKMTPLHIFVVEQGRAYQSSNESERHQIKQALALLLKAGCDPKKSGQGLTNSALNEAKSRKLDDFIAIMKNTEKQYSHKTLDTLLSEFKTKFDIKRLSKSEDNTYFQGSKEVEFDLVIKGRHSAFLIRNSPPRCIYTN